MSRLSLELEKAVRSPHVAPFSLIELDFPDGKVRATSLPFDVVLGGHVYSGLSILGKVSPVTEGAEQRSYGVTLELSAIPLELADYVALQEVQGREVTISQGFVNKGHQIIGEPFVVFRGRMDTMDVQVGETTAVSIACESLLIDWERPRVRRFTDADQKSRHPGDKGLEFVSAMTTKELLWGRE